MSLIDSVRSAIRGTPKRTPASPPISQVIEAIRLDTAIDHALDAIEAAPAARQSATDSHPTPLQCDSGSAPTPPRRRAGSKSPARRRAAAVPSRREQLIVGEAASPRAHAAELLALLFRDGCRPGDRITSRTMQEEYARLCIDRGWVHITWGSARGVGCALRKLCGGDKPYSNFGSSGHHIGEKGAEQTFTRKRVYVLPHPQDVPGLGGGPSASNVTPFPVSTTRRKTRAA